MPFDFHRYVDFVLPFFRLTPGEHCNGLAWDCVYFLISILCARVCRLSSKQSILWHFLTPPSKVSKTRFAGLGLPSPAYNLKENQVLVLRSCRLSWKKALTRVTSSDQSVARIQLFPTALTNSVGTLALFNVVIRNIKYSTSSPSEVQRSSCITFLFVLSFFFHFDFLWL